MSLNESGSQQAQTLADAEAVLAYFKGLQDQICQALAKADGLAQFHEDAWQRDSGGFGRTRVLAKGALFEKAGVGLSHVRGDALPPSATAHRPQLAGCPWQAMGVSLVLHPENPMVPTSHMNVRFFIAYPENQPPVWWFGGGYDLTPYYGFAEDCVHWHQTAKSAVEPFAANLYQEFKQWCDQYFYLKHRQEPRGIGGLFYDDFDRLGFADSFAMTRSVGDSFLAAYLPIVERRRHLSYTQQQRDWQAERRGRYVEFNLVFDRGTIFGLQSGVGRTESILMSLPPQVHWTYGFNPAPDSPEAQLLSDYLIAKDWLAPEPDISS